MSTCRMTLAYAVRAGARAAAEGRLPAAQHVGTSYTEDSAAVAVVVTLRVLEPTHPREQPKRGDFSIQPNDHGLVAVKAWSSGDVTTTQLPRARCHLLDSAARRSPACWRQLMGSFPSQLGREAHGDVAPLTVGSVRSLVVGWEVWASCHQAARQ